MTADQKKIDKLITDGVSPSDIVSYLSSCDFDSVYNAFKESFFFGRIFQLDFFFKCKDDEIRWIMGCLKKIPKPYALSLVWQIMKSESFKANTVKYDYRNIISDLIYTSSIRHPYAFGHEQFVKGVDRKCFDLCQRDKILYLPHIISKDAFSSFMSNIGYSLFAGRVIQLDFMLNLPNQETLIYEFLDNIVRSSPPWIISKFARQVFDSPDIDISVKKFWRWKLKNTFGENETLSSSIREKFNKYNSFQEFYLSQTIESDDTCKEYTHSSSILLYMLLYKPDWIKAWYDIDGTYIDSIMRCGDIIRVIGNG